MSNTENEVKNLVEFFYEVGTLRKIPRSHRQTLLTEDSSDNIAAHSFRVSLIGWFLAKAEGADPTKTAMMCLFHDLSETRSGDQNWVHKNYVKVFENEIINDQIGELPYSNDILPIIQEYNDRKSSESLIAKDADLLDQVLLLREHAWAGNKEAERWLAGKEQGKRLHTETAKRWVKEICSQRPSQWWDNIWTSNRR